VASIIPAVASLLGLFLITGNRLFSDSLISTIINVALVVVLLHPVSREYQKSRFN